MSLAETQDISMLKYYLENGLQLLPNFYTFSHAEDLFQELVDIPLEFGRGTLYWCKNTSKHRICAYGDRGLSYEFADKCIPANPWSSLILRIRRDVEEVAKCKFNFVLMNFYADGDASNDLYKDSRYQFSEESPLACVSFGASRDVEFYRNDVSWAIIKATHGGMYLIYSPTNRLFTHRIPIQTHVKERTITLTFCNILYKSGEKHLSEEDDEYSASSFTPSSVNIPSFVQLEDWSHGYKTLHHAYLSSKELMCKHSVLWS